ncbi:MAG: ATP-dependent Clp protease ATP-binding subunit ClpX [Lachnospiraceae bacterium]|nr:ATP-dependent Clp protease ATP-binding subunit ClpX [Lachnospiraceae bacterium]
MNEYDENSKNTEEETDPQSDNKESNKPDGGSGGNGGGYEQVCSMCHRPESRCGKIMRLPGGLNICSDCMQKSFDAFNQPGGLDINSLTRIPIARIDLSQLNKGAGPQQGVRKKPAADKKPEPQLKFSDVPRPHKIKAMLDEYVVGQEKAKKILSVAVYNHYKRVFSDAKDGVEIEKSNVLLIGPTGSGKTYLVRTLARLLKVPLAIADATSLTEAGYIGDDIESVLSKLLMAADSDVEKAEHGIVFIDEIDKIAKKQNMTSRDVSGESVQQELLKMLEGSRIEVPVGATSKNPMVPTAMVDTKNILFICGGAFPELEEIIRNRLKGSNSIGFASELGEASKTSDQILAQVTMDDLRKFGMIPEFIGRLPVIATLETLTVQYLVRILKEPKNAILKQYQKLMAMDEVALEFEDEALELIAEKAMKKETGARALRSILEEYMLDIMYEIPRDNAIGRVIITRDYLEGKGGPRIILRGMEQLPE